MPEAAPTISLRHSALMPRVGLGTWPMDDHTAERCVAMAIEAGYRLIDTAEAYANETGVGRGLRASGLPRREVFVTTKFSKQWHSIELVAEACQRSAERLGLDYIDLLLIHWPNPEQDRYQQAWEGLIRLLEAGRLRAIGTSNFEPMHLQRIIKATGVQPDVNQIQLNPLITCSLARDFHAQHGIVTESWAPIGGDGASLLDDPLVSKLANQYGRTPAQIVLRWHLELGLVPIPKSSDLERIRTNFEVFDFQLSPEDTAALSALDENEREPAPLDTLT